MSLYKRSKGRRPNSIPKRNSEGGIAPLPYEAEMQKTIIEWTKVKSYKGRKVFDYLHHTPNGGQRNMLEAKRFKQIGVKKGYPDLTIDIVTAKYAGLRIELKRGHLGKMSAEQSKLLDLLNEEGYFAVECDSICSAINTIERYINNEL